MIVINAALPVFVLAKKPFLLAVDAIELPDDYIRYCNRLICGQGVSLP